MEYCWFLISTTYLPRETDFYDLSPKIARLPGMFSPSIAIYCYTCIVALQVFEVERDTKELPTGYLSLHDGYCITRALLPERKRHLVLLPGHIMVNSVLEVQHATGTHSLLKLVCFSYLIIISRSVRSQGLLYKQPHHSISHYWLVKSYSTQLYVAATLKRLEIGLPVIK